MIVRTLILSLCLFQNALAEAEAEADPQFFPLPNAAVNRLDQGCPNVQPLPRSNCAGRKSVCWSPGVRDTDCPGHGLCCYDGCVNTCGAVAAPPPPPPPAPAPLPKYPVHPVVIPQPPPVIHVVTPPRYVVCKKLYNIKFT